MTEWSPGGVLFPSMKKRILVADDNPLIRKMLCKIFSDHEALEICDEAVNGQEAVEKAEHHRSLI